MPYSVIVANQGDPAARPSGGKRVQVLSMTEEMLGPVCDLHLKAFAGRMTARLGSAYLRAFISWFLGAPNAIALVAADEQGAILGYVIGAPVGYTTTMNRQLIWVAARSLIVRPWLLLDRK